MSGAVPAPLGRAKDAGGSGSAVWGLG